MRHYRDKFVAHLDSEREMNIPGFDVPKKCVWFYHAHVVCHEAKVGDLEGLALELDSRYAICEAEAKAVFEAGDKLHEGRPAMPMRAAVHACPR